MDPFASTAGDFSWLGMALSLVTVLAIAVAILAFGVGTWVLRESRSLTRRRPGLAGLDGLRPRVHQHARGRVRPGAHGRR